MHKITQEDLLKMDKEELAKNMESFLAVLSAGKRNQWIKNNMPNLLETKARTEEKASELLNEIEDFIKESESGAYISWINEHDYYHNNDYEEDDYSNFSEWTQYFTDLLTRTIQISRHEEYKTISMCFEKLFDLLSSASNTTDILGNQGVPEDYIEISFSNAIASYTENLLKSKGKDKLPEVLNIIMPLARKFHYRDGYMGLAGALDSLGRKALSQRLWNDANIEWKKSNERTSPDEVDGLIAIAEIEGQKKQVLSIKEQFAKANARYLKDVLKYYKKKKDWQSVAKWAQAGQEHFGKHHEEYVSCLVKAKEAIGDKESVLNAKIEYFFQTQRANEFEDVYKYAESILKLENTLEKLLKSATSHAEGRFGHPDLKIKLLLAIGREKEALDCVEKEKNKLETEDKKFIAKYGLTRICSGLELSNYPALKELDKRYKKENSDTFSWIRTVLKKPSNLNKSYYAQISTAMYISLIDFHLNSQKSKRAEYAAYYCQVIKELSNLTGEPSIWNDLIHYMTQRYYKKKLIWKSLIQKGLINE